jgi:hypothetical protein
MMIEPIQQCHQTGAIMSHVLAVIGAAVVLFPSNIFGEETVDVTRGLVQVHEVARVVPRLPEMPPASAVCFSSRWSHPINRDDPHDTFAAAEAFHATDFVWTYSLDPKFVQRLRQSGERVFLAVNSLIPDPPDFRRRSKGRIVDLLGQPVTAPWMRSWPDSAWGCANSPEYREGFIEYAVRAIQAGATALQMDDPRMNLAAVSWGACFCPHCIEGFRAFLIDRVSQETATAWGITDLDRFDYRQYLLERKAPVGDAFAKYDGGELKSLFAEFQKESVRQFFSYVRGEIDRRAGRHIVFSTNNYRGSWEFPYDLFEIGMAELPQRDATPQQLYDRYREAHDRGKHQIFTLVPQTADGSEVPITRRVIAACYALGGHLIVPWDVYTGSQKPRYYGRPEDYAELYRFVREFAHCFDGYEEAAFVFEDRPDERYPLAPPLLIGIPQVMGVVRAKPQQAAAPVVIHLVDWRDEPSPFAIRLHRRRFPLTAFEHVWFLCPGHPPREISPREASDEELVLEIPTLRPWGLVVLGAARPLPE